MLPIIRAAPVPGNRPGPMGEAFAITTFSNVR
jgi:hypothetical protein